MKPIGTLSGEVIRIEQSWEKEDTHDTLTIVIFDATEGGDVVQLEIDVPKDTCKIRDKIEVALNLLTD